MSTATKTIVRTPTEINTKIDSIKNSKIIDWNAILHEARLHTEQKKENIALTTSIFKEHTLRIKDGGSERAIDKNNSWILGVLIISLLLLGAVRQLNNKRLLSFFSAFFATRFAGQLQREEYAINNRVGTALLLNFILVSSLFVFQLMDHYQIHFMDNEPIVIYLTLCSTIAGIYLVKIIFIRIIAFIFRAESEAKEYIFYILLFNQLLGIFLLPLIIGMSFIKNFDSSILLYFGIAVISILFIYRLLRGIFIGFSKPKISRFYLFLYLCTLEFLPLLFAIKVLAKI